MARLERQRESKRNLEVVVQSFVEAEFEVKRTARCKAVVKAQKEVKRLEMTVLVSYKIIAAGAWQVSGGVVTRNM